MIIVAGLTTLGIDLASPSGAQTLTSQVLPPQTTFNDPVAVSSDGTHVWIANMRGNEVSELNASTGTAIQVIQGPSYKFNQPEAIWSNGTDVWVANAWGNSVTELAASTGALVRVISAGTQPTNPGLFSPTGEFDFPTAICSSGSQVWVLNNNGDLNRWSYTELDASTGALVRVIQGATNADTEPYMGMSCDASHVWVTNGGYWTGPNSNQVLQPGFLTELDSSTGAVVHVIAESALGTLVPDGISSDGTHVWVANLGGASVAELNAATGVVVRVINLSAYGEAANYVSSDGANVWVALPSVANNVGQTTMVQLSAATGAVIQQVTLPTDGTYTDYQKLSSDGTHLWVVNTTNASLTELGASSGALDQVIAANAYGFSSPMGVASDGTHVWVENQNDSITELNASTGALVQVLSGPSYGFGFGQFVNENESIAADGVHVWVANPGSNSVTELDASTGALVQVISSPSDDFNAPVGVSSDGVHVWVTNDNTSTVTELDASTGALVQVLSDPTFGFVNPTVIDSDGTHVWVQNGTHLVGSTWSPTTVTELDATTGSLVQVISGLSFTAMSSDSTHLWGVGGGSVTELNPSTGAIVQTISVSGLDYPQAISSDGTDVWVASTGDNEVVELDASTGAVIQVISASADGLNWPAAITSDGANVWVANEYGNTVTDLGTGVLVQRIIFTSTPPATPLTGGSYTVSAMGGASGNAVTFSVDATTTSVCSISGQTVSFNASGTCIIDANQAAGNGYPAAPQAHQSFVVGSQSIIFTSTPPSAAIVGGPAYTVAATGGASGNPVTLAIDGVATSVCSLTGQAVTFAGAGTCIIDANQAGGNGYVPAPQAQQSFVVGAQHITFTSRQPGNPIVGAGYTVAARGGGSGLPVTFSSDDPSDCVVSGSTVRFVKVGWCDIVANQAGNADWLPAQFQIQSFYINMGFVVSTSSLPKATIRASYSALQLQASGAAAPYKWLLAAGALPKGIQMTSKGVLSGKPAKHDKAGVYRFSVQAQTQKPHELETTPRKALTLTVLS